MSGTPEMHVIGLSKECPIAVSAKRLSLQKKKNYLLDCMKYLLLQSFLILKATHHRRTY